MPRTQALASGVNPQVSSFGCLTRLPDKDSNLGQSG